MRAHYRMSYPTCLCPAVPYSPSATAPPHVLPLNRPCITCTEVHPKVWLCFRMFLCMGAPEKVPRLCQQIALPCACTPLCACPLEPAWREIKPPSPSPLPAGCSRPSPHRSQSCHQPQSPSCPCMHRCQGAVRGRLGTCDYQHIANPPAEVHLDMYKAVQVQMRRHLRTMYCRRPMRMDLPY